MSYNGVVKSIPLFQRLLLGWYRKNRRPLPWRRRRTPYEIWVSEAMLQQTQVATVIPYYHRFLRQFPTVRALAQAPLTQVLDCWSGLGYYSRAKNLHAGAQKVWKERGGKIPDTAEALRTLPGVGPYTAGAIASIAFDRPVPLVDGNVVRVLCRLLGIRKDPKRPDVQQLLWETASRLVDPTAPGDFNQALMELGATLCIPRTPACPRCPVRALCVARRKGWETRIPLPAAPTTRRTIRYLCAVLEKNGRVILARRPLTGLLPGLWEFPGGETVEAASADGRQLKHLLEQRLGIRLREMHPAASVRQTLSHRELEIQAFRGGFGGRPICSSWYLEVRWIPIEQLKKTGLTAGMARLARQIYRVGSYADVKSFSAGGRSPRQSQPRTVRESTGSAVPLPL